MTDKPQGRTAIKLNSLASLVLLVALAIVLAWTSTRFSMEFDWTREGRHTLSRASTEILRLMSGPINITAYARDNPEFRSAIRNYISKYQAIKPDISLLFVNPDRYPDRVRDLGIKINGELIFEYQGRTENVRAADENTIINALVRLSSSGDLWLAYINGHGERSLRGVANHDLGNFGKRLGQRGYNIQPLNLAEVGRVPDNTTVLTLAGPGLPLLDGEISLIIEYLERGGNFLWLLDPDDSNLPQRLLDYLSFEVASGTVIDISGQALGLTDPGITIITGKLYGSHPAVRDFEFTTLFPKAAALLPADSKIWSTAPLLMTGTQTWLETGPMDGEVEFDSDSDLQGPLSIGLALVRKIDNANAPHTRDQRIIVIGDGDFLSNTYLSNAGNLELGMRIVSWLSGEEDLINIPVRSADDRQLTTSTAILGSMGILFLLVMPLLFLGIGVYNWWTRRRN